MSYNIRPYKTEDLAEIGSWWNKHKWGVLPPEMLPKTGFVVESYCAGFLYKTDSSIAILEFIISNPSTDKEKRAEALDLLISTLITKAKEDGHSAIFSSIQHPSLISRYKKHGFVTGDLNMTNMVRVLK